MSQTILKGYALAISKEHKAAMAQGRREARIVRDYLEALRAVAKQRKSRTAEQINLELEKVIQELPKVDDVVGNLELCQRRIDLVEELRVASKAGSLERDAEAFLEVAQAFSERRGISFEAWSDVGVPQAVLEAAGLKPTTGRNYLS